MIQSKNFLINPKIADFIVNAAELRPEDIVLEIGAGKGILTKRILERCKVYAIEIDIVRKIFGAEEKEDKRVEFLLTVMSKFSKSYSLK